MPISESTWSSCVSMHQKVNFNQQLTCCVYDQHSYYWYVLSVLPASIEFCKLTLDYLNNGPNPKKCELAATKYNTTTDIVEDAVKALVMLLINATKSNVCTFSSPLPRNQIHFNVFYSCLCLTSSSSRSAKKTSPPMPTQGSTPNKFPYCGNLSKINGLPYRIFCAAVALKNIDFANWTGDWRPVSRRVHCSRNRYR